MQTRKLPLLGQWYLTVGVCLVALGTLFPQRALANVIFVTTVNDTIADVAGCSLKDAIASSKYHNNVFPYGSGTAPTQCVPGSGNDIIVLPSGATLTLHLDPLDGTFQVGGDNPTGLSVTPFITSTIVLEGYGAILRFAGCPSGPYQCASRLFTVGPQGHLTLHNLTIQGFQVRGGDGEDGGGGGMGAGGVAYVQLGGSLDVEDCTFIGNSAIGGNGGGRGPGDTGGGGGGGGLGGYGGEFYGTPDTITGFQGTGGGGGGGSVGDGGAGWTSTWEQGAGLGGYGGGLVSGSVSCGGTGGDSSGTGSAGGNAPCPGGGGGGGGAGSVIGSNDGGAGNYGGGGGGGAAGGGNGGNGGFGGGGGAGWSGEFGGTHGGQGGFGGGGGSAADGNVAGSSHPGNGGSYGGDASSFYGGGGAALGGTIFNDGGTVVINNSTFSGNSVTRGIGGGAGNPGAADNGADAGGAIFSLSGSLTVNDSTFSGNLSTGSDAAIAVQQTSVLIPASFTLNNTIIYNNGGTNVSGNPIGTREECSIPGSTTAITLSGAGNLIQNNDNCPGVVTTGDPLLGTLQLSRGFTPTMPIGPLSAAFNTADAATSLSTDQRGSPRPEEGGFDIGAYEYCDPRNINCFTVGAEQTQPLTIIVSPPSGGTTVPGPGTTLEVQNTSVVVSATPNPGYVFTNWTGNVAAPSLASTTVIMNLAQTITANFVPCNCPVDVSAEISVTRGGYVLNLATGRYVQTVTLTNISTNSIAGTFSLVLDTLSPNATLFNENGTTDIAYPPAGSPYINAAAASLAPGQNVSVTLQFTDPTRGAITYNTRVLAGPGTR
jgi:Divergent InlB B-repeat domain